MVMVCSVTTVKPVGVVTSVPAAIVWGTNAPLYHVNMPMAARVCWEPCPVAATVCDWERVSVGSTRPATWAAPVPRGKVAVVLRTCCLGTMVTRAVGVHRASRVLSRLSSSRNIPNRRTTATKENRSDASW
jgi:hypothetical protein